MLGRANGMMSMRVLRTGSESYPVKLCSGVPLASMRVAETLTAAVYSSSNSRLPRAAPMLFIVTRTSMGSDQFVLSTMRLFVLAEGGIAYQYISFSCPVLISGTYLSQPRL